MNLAHVPNRFSIPKEKEGGTCINELYIDVFFTVNFTMDYILLAAVRKMLKCPVKYGRNCIRSAPRISTDLSGYNSSSSYTFVKFVLFHGMVNVLMIRAGLLVKWGSDMLRAWILLYISGFLTGGVFQFLGQYMRIGSLFFVLAVAATMRCPASGA